MKGKKKDMLKAVKKIVRKENKKLEKGIDLSLDDQFYAINSIMERIGDMSLELDIYRDMLFKLTDENKKLRKAIKAMITTNCQTLTEPVKEFNPEIKGIAIPIESIDDIDVKSIFDVIFGSKEGEDENKTNKKKCHKWVDNTSSEETSENNNPSVDENDKKESKCKEEVPTIKVGDKELSIMDRNEKLTSKEVTIAIVELLKNVFSVDGITEEEKMELISNITSVVPRNSDEGKFYKIYVNSKLKFEFHAKNYEYVDDLLDGSFNLISEEK